MNSSLISCADLIINSTRLHVVKNNNSSRLKLILSPPKTFFCSSSERCSFPINSKEKCL